MTQPDETDPYLADSWAGWHAVLHRDTAVSTVQMLSGIVTDFTIQIVDGFESADPFPGVGVDDSTLDGRFVTVTEEGIDLILKGPAVTLFQDGVFLREGEEVDPSEYYLRSTPYFETAAPKYDWMNRIVSVGVGRRLPKFGAYDVFRIL